MKLSQKQAQLLLQTLADTLCIKNDFSFSLQTRIQLYKDIISQQDNTPKDLEPESSYAKAQALGARGALGSFGEMHQCGSQLAQAPCRQCGKPHAGYTCDEI